MTTKEELTQRLADMERMYSTAHRERDEANHALRRSLAHANDLAAQVKRLEPDAKRWRAWRDDMVKYSNSDTSPFLEALEEIAPDGLDGCTAERLDAMFDQAMVKAAHAD